MAPGDKKVSEFHGSHGDEGLRGGASWLILAGPPRASHLGQDMAVMLLESLSEPELYVLVQGELRLR